MNEKRSGMAIGMVARLGISVILAAAASSFLVHSYPTMAFQLFHINSRDVFANPRMLVLRFILVFPVFLLLGSWFSFGFHRTNSWLHRYRFVLGVFIVFAAVVVNINGSSLGMWNGWLGHTPFGDVVFGAPRAIRTDEYVVGTPLAFSQAYSGYHYFNSLIGGVPSDMFIIKDAPVLTFAEVFRPFQWGYLILGSSRGLAFYWSARLVALFLASYQVFLLVTRHVGGNERRGIALLGATLLTFSPMIQWWFAVNNLPEMLVAVSVSVVCLDRYCAARRTWARVGYAFAIAECAGMFLLTLYPAWQIPLLYVLLILVVYVLHGRWGTIALRRIDVIGIVASLLALVLLLATVAYFSRGTIYSMTHTVYPGVRHSSGGGLKLETLFSSAGTALLPFKNFSGNSNPTEISGVLDLFPLGIILSVVGMIIAKKPDLLGILLSVVLVSFLFYAIVGVPGWVAKISLFSQVPTGRLRFCIGLINILLLVRAAALLKTGRRFIPALVISALFCVFVLWWIAHVYPTAPSGVFMFFVGVFIVASVCAIISNVGWMHSVALIIAVVLCFFSGLCVNPVQYAARPIENQALIAQAKAIDAKDPGLWVADGDGSSRLANLCTANGLDTLNAVSVTPRLQVWQKIDVKRKYAPVYNRYASITVQTVGSKTEEHPLFKLISSDAFMLSPDSQELHRLGVKYLLSSQQLESFDTKGFSFVPAGQRIDGIQPYILKETRR
jgi:hypothetical protein